MGLACEGGEGDSEMNEDRINFKKVEIIYKSGVSFEDKNNFDEKKVIYVKERLNFYDGSQNSEFYDYCSGFVSIKPVKEWIENKIHQKNPNFLKKSLRMVEEESFGLPSPNNRFKPFPKQQEDDIDKYLNSWEMERCSQPQNYCMNSLTDDENSSKKKNPSFSSLSINNLEDSKSKNDPMFEYQKNEISLFEYVAIYMNEHLMNSSSNDKNNKNNNLKESSGDSSTSQMMIQSTIQPKNTVIDPKQASKAVKELKISNYENKIDESTNNTEYIDINFSPPQENRSNTNNKPNDNIIDANNNEENELLMKKQQKIEKQKLLNKEKVKNRLNEDIDFKNLDEDEIKAVKNRLKRIKRREKTKKAKIKKRKKLQNMSEQTESQKSQISEMDSVKGQGDSQDQSSSKSMKKKSLPWWKKKKIKRDLEKNK